MRRAHISCRIKAALPAWNLVRPSVSNMLALPWIKDNTQFLMRLPICRLYRVLSRQCAPTRRLPAEGKALSRYTARDQILTPAVANPHLHDHVVGAIRQALSSLALAVCDVEIPVFVPHIQVSDLSHDALPSSFCRYQYFSTPSNSVSSSHRLSAFGCLSDITFCTAFSGSWIPPAAINSFS